MEITLINDSLLQSYDENIIVVKVKTIFIFNSKYLQKNIIFANQAVPEPQITCQTCNIAFKSKRTHTLHMKLHTTSRSLNFSDLPEYEQPSEDQEFQCALCGKKFPKELQEVHERSHMSNGTSFLCKICNKSFENEKTLRMHVSAHNETNFSQSKQIKGTKGNHCCQYCNKEFVKPCERLQHERIHNGKVTSSEY